MFLIFFFANLHRSYHPFPFRCAYHNWGHAFAVGHFCFLLLRMPAVKNALLELERFALLVACLCHDIDHPGTTNVFQLQTVSSQFGSRNQFPLQCSQKISLAQLYSSEESVLEKHHFIQVKNKCRGTVFSEFRW